MKMTSRVAFCGIVPFYLCKERTLLSRGLLRPDVMAAALTIACAPDAAVTVCPGVTSLRVEVVYRSVTVVLVEDGECGWPVLLTIFVAGDPVDAAGAVLAAAGVVNRRHLVDLDERLRGAA